jgi:hypothetical protein
LISISASNESRGKIPTPTLAVTLIFFSINLKGRAEDTFDGFDHVSGVFFVRESWQLRGRALLPSAHSWGFVITERASNGARNKRNRWLSVSTHQGVELILRSTHPYGKIFWPEE